MKSYTQMALDNDGFISTEERKVLDAMKTNLNTQKTRLDTILKAK